jgi:mannose-1-phosphate guanylyltransferase
VLDPALLDLLPEGPAGSVVDLDVPLVAEGLRIDGVRVRGAWYDFGRPRPYRDTQLRLLPGGGRDRVLLHPHAQVSPTSRLRRSVVGAGARVGSDARVARSVLWDGAVVEAGAHVEDAIVVSGGTVGRDEHPKGVVVLPRWVLEREKDVGGRVEERDRMAWVELR